MVMAVLHGSCVITIRTIISLGIISDAIMQYQFPFDSFSAQDTLRNRVLSSGMLPRLIQYSDCAVSLIVKELFNMYELSLRMNRNYKLVYEVPAKFP